jgi:hypothetical protein
MAFLRKPYLYLIIGILVVVVLFYFSGLLSPEQYNLLLMVSPISSSIQMGENTTITAIIENIAPQKQTYAVHIVYTSTNLSYYNGITQEPLLTPVYNGVNYTLLYLNDTLGPNENVELHIIIAGDLPLSVSSKRYTVFFEVYAVKEGATYLSDRKSIALTVTNLPP